MDRKLHQLLERAARDHTERIAVVDGERSVSYGELDERANRVAHLLIGLGVDRGDRVGLYLDKSVEAVVGLYGVLKAGAAYVPLDPGAPVARLGYMTANCGIRFLVTGTAQRDRWAGLVQAGAPLQALVVQDAASRREADPPAGLRAECADAIAAQPAGLPWVPTVDLDLSYILYTSGSTGDPKGVMLTHLSAMTFVRWGVEEFGLTPDDRLSSHAPLHFDLSVFDIFAAAASGAAVVLVPPKASLFPVQIAQLITRQAITTWYSVPSILSMLALRGGLKQGDLPSLRTILFAGEVFPTKYLARLMRRLPHVRFANLYGPTETNVCTWYEVPGPPDDEATPIPIGQAIPDVEVFAVTDDGRRAGPGEVGESYVRGTTVMAGYWADRERSASVLFPNPFGGELQDNVYRTGDLVQQDADGNFRYLGRRDSQIKSRGYRIELGDIEAALYSHPTVVECAVVPVPHEVFTNRIKAFVVTRQEVSESDLAGFCGDRLPNYMVPELWEFAERLPKTSTGKVDRRALSTPITPLR